MTADERRLDQYEQDKLIVFRLEGLTKTTDSSALEIAAMRRDIEVMKERIERREEAFSAQMQSIQTRLDKAQNWFLGLLASVIAFVIIQLLGLLPHAK